MISKKSILACCILVMQAGGTFVLAQSTTNIMHDQYRPQVHFSPREKWVNDPNGMVFYNGVYHLFFQYYPDSTVWGPMHWGHAVSTDLVHWQEKPIALYPDSLGYIFSGSAVVDYYNTTGFGKNGKPPLVAIFTSHNPKATNKTETENQSIAYSVDEGNTWTKYAGNPVIKNPGIEDFRDPKVVWYGPGKKWIMTLSAHDRVNFYSSPDLKNWKRESEFGQDAGAHGGVWECPDLFPLDDNGKRVWVLVVNLNPGGPNKGSATQYFTGSFDGNKFTPYSTETKWLDYGPDEYAGITWSNTGNRKIFLGWMSNWMYANLVPTVKWRNAMTIPRELRLSHVGKSLLVSSKPVDELVKIQSKPITVNNLTVNQNGLDLSVKTGQIKLPCVLHISMDMPEDFSLVISNEKSEQIVIGFDKTGNQYFVDRTASGKTDFQNEFAAKHVAPRLSAGQKIDLTLILDESSAELFADGGLTVMTEIFFPSVPYNKVHVQAPKKISFKKITYAALRSIWP